MNNECQINFDFDYLFKDLLFSSFSFNESNGALLRLGPLLIMAPQVEKVRGPALGLVTPVLRFCHRPKAESQVTFKQTPRGHKLS